MAAKRTSQQKANEATMQSAIRKLARLSEQMGGTLAKNGRWFDLPAGNHAVGYGIVTGRYGVTIVSVPR
jgi:hypothetical protein